MLWTASSTGGILEGHVQALRHSQVDAYPGTHADSPRRK
jgi:hypothetical protein